MVKRINYDKVARELGEMLEPQFGGITVEVAHNERWDRMCVTFGWDGFAELLPEERFYRLTRVIPEAFRGQYLAGFAWLELAPGETIDAFLKHPRSEDIAPKEGTVYRGLARVGFFDALASAMGPSPDTACTGDLSQTLAVLNAEKYSPAKIRDAKLVFIRHRAYCDCQVLMTALPALTEAYDKVAG